MIKSNRDLYTRLFVGFVVVGAVALSVAVIAITLSYFPEREAEAFQKLADGLQKLALTIAMIGGAIWTLFTFSALHTRDLARAELASLQTQLERQATLHIAVITEPIDFPGYYSHYAKVTVRIKNTGNRNTTLARQAALVCAELVPLGDEVAPLIYTSFSPIGEDNWRGFRGKEEVPIVELPAQADYVLRVGMEIDIPFLVRLPGPGTYHVQFRTPLHAEELPRMHALGMQSEEAFWVGEHVFTVPNSSEKSVLGAPTTYAGPYPKTVASCESALRDVAAEFSTLSLQDPRAQSAIMLCNELADIRRFLLFSRNAATDAGDVVRSLLLLSDLATSAGIDVQSIIDAFAREDMAKLQSAADAAACEALLTQPVVNANAVVPQ